MERAEDSSVEFDPVMFDLAKGTKVRVEFAKFLEKISVKDRALGAVPTPYFAIRVYSDEDTYPSRIELHTEFRSGTDFIQCAVFRLQIWLRDLAVSRHRLAYDSVEDFLEEFAERMDEFGSMGDDMADHVYKTNGTISQPSYENPDHVDFPEDQIVRTRRFVRVVTEKAAEELPIETGTSLEADDNSGNVDDIEQDDELPEEMGDADEVETNDEGTDETDDKNDVQNL